MKILMVEDDRITVMILKMIFGKLGIDLACFTNGDEAINAFDETYDLVITDWVLPGLSGLDLIEHFRCRKDKKVPVILMSSMPDHHLKETAEKAGANGFLCKPVDEEILKATIKQITGAGVLKNAM